jgi:hypothetical protein
MPAHDAITRRAKPITIKRKAAGGYVNGIWQAGAETQIGAFAVIQPLGGNERALLPEGIRETGKWRVWSTIELRVKDTLQIHGTDCVLIAVERWPDHYRAIAGDEDGGT